VGKRNTKASEFGSLSTVLKIQMETFNISEGKVLIHAEGVVIIALIISV